MTYQHVSDHLGGTGLPTLGAVTAYQLLVRFAFLTSPEHQTPADIVFLMDQPGRCLSTWEAASRAALGRRVPMHEAGRRELYAICRFLVADIESRPTGNREDWFPHGWRESAALVKGEIQARGDSEMSDDERRALLMRQVDEMKRRA